MNIIDALLVYLNDVDAISVVQALLAVAFISLFVSRLHSRLSYQISKAKFFKNCIQSSDSNSDREQIIIGSNYIFIQAMKAIDEHMTICWPNDETDDSESASTILKLLTIKFDAKTNDVIRRLDDARAGYMSCWRDKCTIRFRYRLSALRLAFFCDVYQHLLKDNNLKHLQVEEYVTHLLPKLTKLKIEPSNVVLTKISKRLRQVKTANELRLSKFDRLIGLSRITQWLKLTKISRKLELLKMANYYQVPTIAHYLRLPTIVSYVRMQLKTTNTWWLVSPNCNRVLRDMLYEMLMLAVEASDKLIQHAIDLQDSLPEDGVDKLENDEKSKMLDKWMKHVHNDDLTTLHDQRRSTITQKLTSTDELISISEELTKRATTKTIKLTTVIFEVVPSVMYMTLFDTSMYSVILFMILVLFCFLHYWFR